MCNRHFHSRDMHRRDLTKDNLIVNNAIEELKVKLSTNSDSVSHAEMLTENRRGIPQPPTLPQFTEDGLILPKKPPNPVLESSERQNLHRELLFNKKIGKNVLNQKSELQKALEKHKDNKIRKELETQTVAKTSELEKIIADRAKRLEGSSKEEVSDDRGLSREFLEARAKLRTTAELKNDINKIPHT